jgi:hypothetical protein
MKIVLDMSFYLGLDIRLLIDVLTYTEDGGYRVQEIFQCRNKVTAKPFGDMPAIDFEWRHDTLSQVLGPRSQVSPFYFLFFIFYKM